jgi:very-short-patch-repair endonuclease
MTAHRATLADDNRRQNRLFNAGVELIRFTAADVLGNPADVVNQVRLALARRSGRRSHY